MKNKIFMKFNLNRFGYMELFKIMKFVVIVCVMSKKMMVYIDWYLVCKYTA